MFEIYDPYPLQDVLFSLRSRETPDTVAASWAALNLGCALMLQSSDELVLRDFSEDNNLRWPNLPHAREAPITDGDLRQAEELAGPLSRIMSANPGEIQDELENFRNDLFGDNPERARLAALALPLASMAHSHPLVQVSAAAATLLLARNPLRTGHAFNILARLLTESNDELIQNLAFLGLARPFKGLLPVGIGGWSRTFGNRPQPALAARDALLVHGTVIERHGTPPDLWWKPPLGDLHQYLKSGSMPQLYAASDHYRWSGGWSDYAREEAADKLVDWLTIRRMSEPDIIAHSHGCNVTMLASHHVTLNRLLLLSCPVHWSSYQPGHVRDVVSIRINWDLTIMADGGAQRFPGGAGILEEVLPLWFTTHSTSHKAATWASRKLDRFL